jgi:hypothetical protein
MENKAQDDDLVMNLVELALTSPSRSAARLFAAGLRR